MICPDFRTTEIAPIIDQYRIFISENHGDGLWKDLEMDFNRVFAIRKEATQVSAFRADPEQLKKYKSIYLELY
jgi:programmed cell death 6-interacting protein